MSTALPRQKVETAIAKLKPDLRRRCNDWFRKEYEISAKDVELVKLWLGEALAPADGEKVTLSINSKVNWYRYGSENFAKRFPDLGVTDKQRALMYACHQEGMSFREIEETFHLSPQSGNDAQRCCRQHAALVEQGLVSKSARSSKFKSDLSRSQVVRVVESYMKRKPKRANAVFKEIEMLMPHPEGRTVAV